MRWIVLCLLVAVGYWYFFVSPQQDSAQSQQAGNADALMRDCRAKARYAARRTATSDYGSRSECARELNLYHEGGHWYSYDETRR